MQIRHDPQSSRFSAIDGDPPAPIGELEYRIDNEQMVILHTGVRPEFEGKGIASQLVQTAVEWAAGQHLRVRPVCSYARLWMSRHPDAVQMRAD